MTKKKKRTRAEVKRESNVYPLLQPTGGPATLELVLQRLDALNGEVKRLRLRVASAMPELDMEAEEDDQDALKADDLACGRCGSPAEYVLCEHCTRMTGARLEYADKQEKKGKA
jgi:hypothetical protein